MTNRVLAGRWAPAKLVTKRQLRISCEHAGISPRPNWLHASHEELVASLAPALQEAGVIITARLDQAPRAGGREIYQSIARWGVRRDSNDAAPGSFSWDAQTGKFRASFPGPRYAEARAALEQAIRIAEEHASIRREDIRDQLALAIMGAAPLATYCMLPEKPGTYVVGPDVPEFTSARRFLRHAGFPLSGLVELDGPADGFHALISRSLESARLRYGARTGWVTAAELSHSRFQEGLR